ncbi:hypothetical protein IMG5_023410, partial [Ichthyophthirius multifiliis]
MYFAYKNQVFTMIDIFNEKTEIKQISQHLSFETLPSYVIHDQKLLLSIDNEAKGLIFKDYNFNLIKRKFFDKYVTNLPRGFSQFYGDESSFVIISRIEAKMVSYYPH